MMGLIPDKKGVGGDWNRADIGRRVMMIWKIEDGRWKGMITVDKVLLLDGSWIVEKTSTFDIRTSPCLAAA